MFHKRGTSRPDKVSKEVTRETIALVSASAAGFQLLQPITVIHQPQRLAEEQSRQIRQNHSLRISIYLHTSSMSQEWAKLCSTWTWNNNYNWGYRKQKVG